MPETGRKVETLRTLHIRVLHTLVDAFVGTACKFQTLHYTVTDIELSGASFTATTQFWCCVIFILVVGNEIRKRKANLIGHILLRNCLLKQVIEGKIKGEMEVTRRRGRRRKKLLGDLKDRRGCSHLKEEALDRTMWRNRFGGSLGPVVRQNTE